MDIFEAIHTRRSIRQFDTRKPVSPEDLRQMLRAAMSAPSAGNAQPWHFVVVTDADLKDRLAAVHPYVAMLRQAPLGIVACAELSLEKYPGNWVQDLSAAVQNLLLAACALGLGAVWTGLCPEADRMDAVHKILNLPEGVVAHSIIPVGWPAQESKPKDRFRPERIHQNAW